MIQNASNCRFISLPFADTALQQHCKSAMVSGDWSDLPANSVIGSPTPKNYTLAINRLQQAEESILLYFVTSRLNGLNTHRVTEAYTNLIKSTDFNTIWCECNAAPHECAATPLKLLRYLG